MDRMRCICRRISAGECNHLYEDAGRNGTYAVSYTHLDVYKRQTLDNAVTLVHAGGATDIGQWPRIPLALSGLAAGFIFDIKNRKYMGIVMYLSLIHIFYSNGNEEVYMGSADWMPRNLDKRVEIVFPVEDPRLKQEVMHILDIQLEDNVKAHILRPDGIYEKIDKRGKTLVNAQEYFCEEATERAKIQKDEQDKRVFVPAEPIEG